MVKKNICLGLAELRIKADLALLGKTDANFSIRYMHLKLLPKGDSKIDFMHHSMIFKPGDFPVMREDLRQDIFAWYNTRLRVITNAAMKHIRSLITTKGDTIISEAQAITDYSEDLQELRKLAKTELYIDKSLDKLLTLKSDVWSDEVLQDLYNRSKYYIRDEKDVLPLITTADYKVIVRELPSINNKLLANGSSLIVSKYNAKTVLALEDEFYIDVETIICTSKEMYLLVPLSRETFSITKITQDDDI